MPHVTVNLILLECLFSKVPIVYLEVSLYVFWSSICLEYPASHMIIESLGYFNQARIGKKYKRLRMGLNGSSRTDKGYWSRLYSIFFSKVIISCVYSVLFHIFFKKFLKRFNYSFLIHPSPWNVFG